MLKKTGLLLLVTSIALFCGVKNIFAAEHQVCNQNTNCIVGEFIFDDNYAPINIGVTCNYSSRDPNGNVFVSNALMTASEQNDGWYFYTLNIGQTDGVYPSQMCCTVPEGVGSTQYMCLDKSFKVQAAPLTSSQTANAVWDSQSVGHTAVGSFGKNLQNPTLTLADIWNYSSRTLTIGSSLVQEIWDYTETSTNNFANLISKIWSNNAVASIATKTDILGVGSSLSTIDSKIDSLDIKITSVGSTVSVILGKWGTSSASDIISSVTTVQTRLGTNTDTCANNTIYGNIACVRDKWGAQTADTLYTAANNAYSTATALRSELNYNGKSTNAYDDMQAIKNYVDTLESGLATATSNVRGDIASVKTVVDSIETKVNSLDAKVSGIASNLDTVISKWGSYSASDIISNINTAQTKLGVNTDTCAVNSIFGNIACVRSKWGTQTADTLFTAANNSYNIGTSLLSELTYSGKTSKAYEDIQTISNYVDSLESSIGNSTDLSSTNTLFGKIKNNNVDIASVQSTVNSIDTKIDSLNTKSISIGNTVGTILSKWGTSSASDIISSVTTVQTRLGTNTDTCANNTIYGNIACVRDKWGAQTADTLYSAANNSYGIGTSIIAELTHSGKTTKVYEDLQTLATSTSNIRGDIATLDAKINSLDTKISGINTNVNTLISKWSTYSISDVLTATSNIGNSLGTTSDTCATNSVFGNIACIKDKWGTESASSLYTVANNAYSTISSLRSELDYNGKSTTAYADLQTVKNYVDSLESGLDSTTSLIRGDIAGVQTTVDSIVTKVNLLSTQVTTINATVNNLVSKWGSYTITDVVNNVNSINSSIGVSGDTCGSSSSIFGVINCIQNNGSTGDNTAVLSAITNMSSTISNLSSELNYNGKSSTAYADVQSLKTNLDTLLVSIGSSSDSDSIASVFGRIKKMQATIEGLNLASSQATSVIDKWGTYSASDIYDKVKDLSSQISAINTVSNVSSILSVSQTSATDLIAMKNQILALKALANVNITLLEKTTVKPIIKTWLEEGSVIFKTMITNPGTTTQTVPFKFYLPKEADKKNVMKIDSGLDITFDSNQSTFYISGDFTLKPNETKIVAIEVEDVWKVQENQIESLKIQAQDLSKPLVGTAYFAQGVTLKSDIIVQLDNILRTQNEAVTPDSRIKVYRDNVELLKRVQSEIVDLKGLVTSLSSSNSLMGFVGGSQAVSLWGIVLIIIVGIVFLTVYMQSAIGKLGRRNRHNTLKVSEDKPSTKHNLHHSFRLTAIIFLTFVPTFLLTFFSLNNITNTLIVGRQISTPSTIAQNTPQVPVESAVLGEKSEKTTLVIPPGSNSIKIRYKPDPDSIILANLWKPKVVTKYGENGDWIDVETDILFNKKPQIVRGWVNKIFLINN